MAGELMTFRPLHKLREMVPGEYDSTLDPRDKRNHAMLAAACRGRPPSIEMAVNTVVVVSNLVFYAFDKMHEDTGELQRLPRLVIISPKGEMYSMSGWKAIEDVMFPVAVLGFSLPFNPPHRFKVGMVPSGRSGKKYAALEWLGVNDK